MGAEDERVRASSWTGSEALRHEQGVCLPPPERGERCYRIAAGIPCEVTREGWKEWREHRTSRDLVFAERESVSGGFYTFREGAYVLRVSWFYVRWC